MNKLKFLLTILMAALIAFAAQRAYYVRMQMIGSIYSDIIFTRLAVESQEYTLPSEKSATLNRVTVSSLSDS